MVFILLYRTAHRALRAVHLINGKQLVVHRIIHDDTCRRSHPDNATAVHHGIIGGRTGEECSRARTFYITHGMSTGVEDGEILRMADEHFIALHSEEGADIVGWQLAVANIIGCHSVGLRIHHLEATTQGSYHQSVLSILCHAPYTVVDQVAGAHLISFPLTVTISYHTSVEGAEVHRSITHGDTAHHDFRLQPGRTSWITYCLTRHGIVAQDTGIIGSTPQIALGILRDGAHIT